LPWQLDANASGQSLIAIRSENALAKLQAAVTDNPGKQTYLTDEIPTEHTNSFSDRPFLPIIKNYKTSAEKTEDGFSSPLWSFL